MHVAKTFVYKLRFLIGRRRRRERENAFDRQHYSTTMLQGEYRRMKACENLGASNR